jgi:hypothetical protein
MWRSVSCSGDSGKRGELGSGTILVPLEARDCRLKCEIASKRDPTQELDSSK